MKQASTRMVRFAYEMSEAESGRKLTTGAPPHIFCGRDMRPLKLPEKYLGLFRQ